MEQEEFTKQTALAVLIEVGGKGGIDRINETHGIDGMETRNEC